MTTSGETPDGDAGTARPPNLARLSVSLVGSFRKFYVQVVQAAEVFEAAGIVVRSPVICEIVNQGESYVRFATDPPRSSDHQIQAATNDKIRASDFVYVVAPGGYVGRATCLELGMIYALGIPAFYSELPEDVPINVSPDSVMSAGTLVNQFRLGRLVSHRQTNQRENGS
jgi:hypothetical protein